jgi:hypothetical protein
MQHKYSPPLALFVTACAACCASSLLPYHRPTSVVSFRQSRRGGAASSPPLPPAGPMTWSRGKMASRRSSDDASSYNDDAFGLVFLIGGILSQDADFVATFALLSASAAACTRTGLATKDERAPAAVAIATLLLSPIVASVRRYGSLEYISAPIPVECGLCLMSVIWAFVNKSREGSN